MSRPEKRSLRGWWFAVLLGMVGCDGPWVEEPPPGAEAVPELPAEGEELGTERATRCKPAFMVEQSPGVSPSYLSPALTPLKGRVYFLAPSTEGGPSALWRSDATGAGTSPISENVSPPLLKAGQLLYFAQNGSLWASDGTAEGTQRLKSLEGGRLIGVSQDVRGRLFFSVSQAEDSRRELWVSDGTPRGTRSIASFSSVPYTLSQMIEFRGQLFFTAADAAQGMELWRSDGTPGGTGLFKDIAPGPADSSPSQLIVAGSALYFVANDQVHGEELWTARSLNPARTSLVKDFVPGAGSSYSRPLAELHGKLYFTLHPADPFADLELWRTDGSPHGTVRVKRFSSPDPASTELWSWTSLAVGNSVYFVIQPLSATGPWAGNAQLWRTDGTRSGTYYLTEPLTYGDQGPAPELFAVGRTLLFAALDNVPFGDPRQHGQELWSTQGTVSSTRLLQDLRPGPDWSYPSSFVQAGRSVYFLALDAAGISRLWALPVDSAMCNTR